MELLLFIVIIAIVMSLIVGIVKIYKQFMLQQQQQQNALQPTQRYALQDMPLMPQSTQNHNPTQKRCSGMEVTPCNKCEVDIEAAMIDLENDNTNISRSNKVKIKLSKYLFNLMNVFPFSKILEDYNLNYVEPPSCKYYFLKKNKCT